MEFLQTNFYTEAIITKIYVSYLRRYTKEIYSRMLKLIKRRSPNPRLVIVVATHVSLAHQIAQIKSKLSLRLKVKIILCVVVTDDTPLIIWAVKGADLIFVPSLKTCNYLSSYAQKFDVAEKPKFVVNAYPISTKFSILLSAIDIISRIDQLSVKDKPLNIILPVSGAAVSLDYFREVISYLTNKKRALFTVVSRESSYTRRFLDFCESNSQVTVMADFLDRDVVLSYENAISIKSFCS